MTVTLAAISAHTYWAIALSIALRRGGGRRDPADGARVRPSGTSSGRSTACSRSRARSPRSTANIPQLEATAPVLGADRGRSGGPGRLHERAHRRVR